MEKMRPIFCRLVLLGFSFVPLAYAHHGYAAYDMTKTVTVTGTVVEMTMANPHSSLTFDVKDEKGNLDHWAIEFGTLRGLLSEGWTRDGQGIPSSPAMELRFLSTPRRMELT